MGFDSMDAPYVLPGLDPTGRVVAVPPDGHVAVVRVMGGDAAVVQAARVSYGLGLKDPDADRHLIRYIMRHRHTSPFEHAAITLRVRVPMDAWRQWIRHRTASVNEYSTRYKEAINSAAVTEPDAWREQAASSKQGSAGFLSEQVGAALSEREVETQRLARAVYEERLAAGVAREQARKDLPLSTYTEAYWTIDLHNLLHFLELRLAGDAQAEIRAYAEAIATFVEAWVPWTWEAFEDYRLGAVTFTAAEVAVLSTQIGSTLSLLDNVDGLSGRERAEFEAKLRRFAP